jgi:microcystin-dependent protein
MMAATAKYRDDISGSIVTTGTSTIYSLTSNSNFDSLAHMNGQVIAFSPHATNGSIVTLNVDGLGARPLQSSPGVELPAGVLVQGTPYLATYSVADGRFYLQSFFGNPYNIPIAGAMPFFGNSAPNSNFAFPFGQAISRTTYATLFSITSTTFGSGDGTTTFNLPDLRGRVVAGVDNMGGSAASRLTSTYFGANASTMGSVGGGESETLSLGQLPTGITAANAAQAISVAFAGGAAVPATFGTISSTTVVAQSTLIVPTTGASWSSITAASGSNSISVTSNNTSGNPHNVVQPTIVTNYIMRLI